MQTTYYKPHISGLTLHAQRLAEALVAKGYQVSMLTSRYLPELKKTEKINGVKVCRSYVLFFISKGPFMPFFLLDAYRYMKEVDVVHLFLPNLEALALAVLAKIFRKKLVVDYICDIKLVNVRGGRIFMKLIDLIQKTALKSADIVVTMTKDYQKHSRNLKNVTNFIQIYPVIYSDTRITEIAGFTKNNAEHYPVLGLVGRISSEKGIDLAISVASNLRKIFPKTLLAIVGEFKAAPGEAKYFKKIALLVKENLKWIRFMGKLSDRELNYFYKNIDILLITSTNSTEAFNMTQIEAMRMHTPVVVPDLPGVREPVMKTKFGEIAKVGDVNNYLKNIKQVLAGNYQWESARLENYFPEKNIEKYCRIYQKLFGKTLND